jgi:hypothetical protein
MFCPKCNAQNPDNAVQCSFCGANLRQMTPPGMYQPQQAAYAPKPSNNLVGAILVTIFCCLIGGIVSIVYAAKVDGLWASGDYAGATAAANQSKTWMWISLGVGLLVNLAYVGMMIAAAGASHSTPIRLGP